METDPLDSYINEFARIQEVLSELAPELEKSDAQISVLIKY